MSGPLSNLSSQIIQSQIEKANIKDQQEDSVQSTIVSTIEDLKEEINSFASAIKKDKKIEQPSKDKQISQELLEMQEQEEGSQPQIERSDQKFQQATEFLTKGQRQDAQTGEKIGSFAASIIQDDNVKKTDKKKAQAKLEEKLEMLASLEGDFKDLNLKPEDRELIEEFFDKMARMKNLKTRLKQLLHLEKKYEEDEKEEKRRQGQQPGDKQKKEEPSPKDQKDMEENKDAEQNKEQDAYPEITPVPINIKHLHVPKL